MAASPLKPQDSTRSHERTVTVVWPSISAGPWGQWLGRLYSNRFGFPIGGVPLTLGRLMTLLTAPIGAVLYLVRKAPRWPLVLVGTVNTAGVRYRVTTQRLLIENPFEKDATPVAALPLDGFDEVKAEVQPGQDWYHAADVVLLERGVERLRLAGVPRPEPFMRTVMKTQQAAAINRPAKDAARQAGHEVIVAI
ncbi:hypothetical protein [Botrimarina mediterranea]|uniref:hypothetical protein n=1 Tax=Botrimarina mediterranea TaxID=2528022 RepID=UPI00118CCFD2|nr:hypothetical protein K2D_17540 [Planctomycetes bacterium K2D]